MNYFAKNIAYLRKQKKLTQAQMQDSIGFPRTTWASYESRVSQPDIDGILVIADFFGVEPNDLLKSDLSKGKVIEKSGGGKNHEKGKVIGKPIGKVIGQNEPILVAEPAPEYGAKVPKIITLAPDNNENIVYVPVRARAGYLTGYGDPEYIANLPAFRMPGLSNGTYRMFEVEGLSMSPTLLDKDRVIGQWVDGLQNIRENRVHVIIHKNGIAVKRVLNRIDERGKIYLKSDTLTHRADYPTIEVDPADIYEMWYVRLKVSADLSEPAEIYRRVADLELGQMEILNLLKQSGIKKGE